MASYWMKLVGSEWEEGAEEMNAFVLPLSPNRSKFVLLFSESFLAHCQYPDDPFIIFTKSNASLRFCCGQQEYMYEHLATARRPDYVRLLLQFNILSKFLDIIYL